MDFEFTNTTLTNVLKQAKKLTKSTNYTLKESKDIRAEELGFKSYSDLTKNFYEWLNKEPVYLLLRQGQLAHHTYQKKEHDKNIPYYKNTEDTKEQQRQITSPEELNHVKNCALKLMKNEENKRLQEKYSRFVFNHIPAHFFLLTSFRIENLSEGKRLNYDTAYKIFKYLSDRVKIHGDCYYESVDFSDEIYLVGDSFYHASDLFDEDYSDHVMPADFYS